MHVKIQGGGDGVYANSGSCTAAAMYCEHERQELMDKGLKPETFFHQYSDFVSTREVIDRIDSNKKKLRKNDAKFFVMTVSPSADEQRKMGESLDERIAAFKSYIRNGVMAEYANNFERGLSANDIMYYAYIHVDRGDKTGEQMHAHIIISRRNMENSISLSPKSNHRSGKGVIAHGFNRDRFNKSCERVFDDMMSYTRSVEDSYEYRNAFKNGNYQDIANVMDKAFEREYGVDLSDWDRLVNGVFDKEAVTETASPRYTELDVTENKAPAKQTTDTSIISFAKKAWNFAAGLFGKKALDSNVDATKQDVPAVKDEPTQSTDGPSVRANNGIGMYITQAGDQFNLVYYNGDYGIKAYNIDKDDALKLYAVQKSEDKDVINKCFKELYSRYFRTQTEQKELVLHKAQEIGTNQKTVEKQVQDGIRIFKGKGKEHYSAGLYRDGKRVHFAEKVDTADVTKFIRANKTGNKDYIKKVTEDISSKYFIAPLARKAADEFRRARGNQNLTSAKALRGHNGYCWVKYEVNHQWQPGYKMSETLARDINTLGEDEIRMVFNIINNMLTVDFPAIACGSTNNNRKRNNDDDEKKKRGRRKR